MSADANPTGGRSSATPGAGSQELAPPNHESRDLTPGDHDVPPFHLGRQDMYAISPDGQEVAYASNIDEIEATSTNTEIFTVPIDVGHASGLPSTDSQAGGSRYSTPKKISTSPGADMAPLYSPDGKHIAWRSQARTGFEADKSRLMLYERESARLTDLTQTLDHSIGSFARRVP